MNNQPIFETLESEIEEVQSSLLAATTDLTNPLGELVRAQIKNSQPLIYGALALAVSKPQTTPVEDNELYRKRILLASALEMLHIALNVHRLLVNAAIQELQVGGENSLDRSFIGSTILAGDYCFSRAAQMAAKTDHPRVVATFSLALQTVSEELLREQFKPSNVYDETRQLLNSGAQAAALLVGLSEKQQQEAAAFSQEVAQQWALRRQTINDGGLASTPATRPTAKSTLATASFPPYWQALQQWLKRQQTNVHFPATTHGQYR